MNPTSEADLAERAELAAVLGSRSFGRAATLRHLLRFLCERVWAGREEEITEYSIGVEALGRREDFDPKSDTIVRVEMHHLRKRLKQYYADEGSGRTIQIAFPPGQYRPHFLRTAVALERSPEPLVLPEAESLTTGEAEPAPLLEEADEREVSLVADRPRTGLTRYLVPAALALVLVAAAVVFAWRTAQREVRPQAAQKVTLAASPVAADGAIRILAGAQHGSYADHAGHVWLPDQYVRGGESFRRPNAPITGTADPALFRSGRSGYHFQYDIPLAPGVYELHLLFAETEVSEVAIRTINVYANDTLVLKNLDIYADTGAQGVPDEQVLRDIRPASDGRLHLKFACSSDPCFLNAIEIFPGIAGQLRPVRLVSAPVPYQDTAGRLWAADQYFQGGQHAQRTRPIMGTTDPDIYKYERYGHFSYVIPVAPGKYTLRLFFSEMWFGPTNPGREPVEQRSFDVYCNGVALLRGLQVGLKAGGENRALVETFRHLEPNAQNKFVLSFVPIRNYATINALEVIDEASGNVN